ncbi:hypothetical protein THAOC_18375 [Thalassiosira oceanica]|uniref:Uncharacterized protein n=1 Tax=Thalassiosira oceanica TaxID=159749 RepID=K0S8H4_THAOC|nr:hypothetical protein THAOC_18375 [Thalassiosira oceanica]|eukprot:EJK61179.1 hypothetical protein THAOC_18375 [Thalassiosira oceanica]
MGVRPHSWPLKLQALQPWPSLVFDLAPPPSGSDGGEELITFDSIGTQQLDPPLWNRINNWCLELHFAGGGTALRNQGDLFLGFLEGDIVGEVAMGRLSMILDIVRGVKRTLAACLAPHLGVPPKGTHLESGP